MMIKKYCFLVLMLVTTAFARASQAIVIECRGAEWILDTGLVRKVVRLEGGQLGLVSFRNEVSGHEYVTATQPSPEIRLSVDGTVITGRTGGWTLISNRVRQLGPGQWQLDLKLQRETIEVEKHYLAYTDTPIIREWLTITNVGGRALKVEAPCFLAANLLSSETKDLDLSYVTGGGEYLGSQLLKTEPMSAGYSRVFDSQIRIQTNEYRGTCYGVYLPLLVQRNRHTHDGIMVGWDYLGHWTLQVGVDSATGSCGNISLQIAGYSKMLESGRCIETPKAFIGAFTGDLDAMGNTLLDWQYLDLWDYTNDNYFARTRWAVNWTGTWLGDGGTPSGDNWGRRLADDLRYIDLMREAGGDILWDDAGWYDKFGSWQAPEWRLTNEYLAKYNMRWVLWFPTYLALPTSRVGQEHPEWLVPGGMGFEQSIRATAEWQYDLLAQSVRTWGDFQWRYDGFPAFSANDTDFLESDQNFRWLVEKFKSSFPSSGIDACHGGGHWISYDLARFAESGEYTDGGVGPYSSYYTSLLIPPDKYHNLVDPDHTYYQPASDRIHLCMDPTWYRDPGDGVDVESIRQDWDLYHYLRTQQVVGRWSHVFRPDVSNDDSVWYFQRMNREGSKGFIVAKHAHTAPAYFLTAQRLAGGERDGFQGMRSHMCLVSTTGAAAIDTGIYQDPIDGEHRYYGFGDEIFGPVNFKYEAADGEVSFVTVIAKPGPVRPATELFFGMSIRPMQQTLVITQLGLISRTKIESWGGDANTGKYRMRIIRADDRRIVASAEIDLAQGISDRLGFKYVKLPEPVRLDPTGAAVIIHPHGLNREAEYDVRCAKSDYRARRTGADLMEKGIALATVQPGELVFLNLPKHPGAGTDKILPSAPSQVTKRIGTNLGVQGVEVQWEKATDDNWISFYEILRDGVIQARAAKGTFYFDHQGEAGQRVGSHYEVRTVDGDGNRSDPTPAKLIAGEAATYRALGSYSPTQTGHPWRYEETIGAGPFRPMHWENIGYEGLWCGSGQARIGRIWMQAGAASDVARVFVVPEQCMLTIEGMIHKDPSAENGRTVDVKVMQNDCQIWPAYGWAGIEPHASKPMECHIEPTHAVAGDLIRFVARRTGNQGADPILWDPIITLSRSLDRK